LVEFVLELSDEFKIRGGEIKALLRHALSDILPSPIRHRHHKLGFAAPEEPWLQSEAARVRKILCSTVDEWPALLTPAIVRHFDRWIEGRRSYDPGIFRVLAFGSWARIFGAR
jgi:asparagine synthase (glutamine-hydrolysing)